MIECLGVDSDTLISLSLTFMKDLIKIDMLSNIETQITAESETGSILNSPYSLNIAADEYIDLNF